MAHLARMEFFTHEMLTDGGTALCGAPVCLTYVYIIKFT